MQYSYIETLKKILNNNRVVRLIKGLIVVIIFYFIYSYLSDPKKFSFETLKGVISALRGEQYFLFISVLGLVFVNWGLEALKWKLLVEKVEKISYVKAYMGVLTGLSFGFITPHSIGDYFGRVFQLNQSNRGQAIGAVFISRVSQLVITLFFGLMSLIFIYKNSTKNFDAVILLSVLGVVLIGLLIFFRVRIIKGLSALPLFSGASEYVRIIQSYTNAEVIKVFMIAFLRYLVFMSQYIIVLKIFQIDLSLSILFFGVGYVFLIKSLFALNSLIGLGLRESSALFFFSELMGAPAEVVLLSGGIIWLVNILFPTVVGALLVFKIKLTSKVG